MRASGSPGRAGLAPLACLAGLAAAACQSAAPAPPRAAPAAARPNIVLILADDLDTSPVAHMPILAAQLVRRGTTFRNAFVTTPVCAPSRASILTGRYSHNHKLLHNKPPVGGYRKFPENGNEDSHLGLWLQAAGYRTGLIGKYLNRYPTMAAPQHVPKGWDDWRALFFPESYWSFRMNENGAVTELGKTDEEYQTDVLAARAVSFIAQADARPFFLYLSPFAPHAPAEPAVRHEAAFPDLKAPRPPSFDEEDVDDKPAWVKSLPRMSAETIARTDDWFRRRVQAMQAVDEMIGKVVQAVEARGELQRTYFVFFSDNGFELGEHRLDHGKGGAYEESIRVPCVIRGPGVPEGLAVDSMVLNIDLAPTFAALGGAVVPPTVDGRSLVPLLGGRPPAAGSWRRDFLVEAFENAPGGGRERGDDEDGGIPEYAALRTEQHLYVEYPKSDERELYDLRTDRYQLQNIHNVAPAELVQRLALRLGQLRSCAGEGCRR